ncbi:cache domain-containing protein [Ditylenchus destructor]|uniref:Cache domain-containing protein n=1 Tax=Ditylenchus destructor TaxID=166010 RepID=A0AAD4R7Y3_9BILA|nr:cache domain-containing protein [Ditylenchus destructor]
MPKNRTSKLVNSSVIHWTLLARFLLLCLLRTQCAEAVNAESVTKWANELSEKFRDTFKSATKYDDIIKSYGSIADAEVFDPHSQLKAVKRQLEIYLRERAKMAWDAKVSLESKELHDNVSSHDLNDPLSKNFVRYLNAKKQTDAAVVFLDGHMGGNIEINQTREYIFRRNVNFYGIPTNSEASAVHVPTQIYNRNPYVLERIQWSDIDQVYRRNRERLKDLSFQKFCSERGFMRYFPAAPWIWDSKELELDVFDCRSTEWFIDAATMSKNVLILLDLSGSMLGQRFEIAKQTVEAILETLSDNDFFNIMAFSKTINLLDECSEDGLLQATMRNKKLLWSRLANISSEGKAEYEKALSKAFSTLMNLPASKKVEWRTKEELARDREDGVLDTTMHYIPIDEHFLVLPQAYVEAIKKFTGNSHEMGCNDMIMLITDGAPSFYKEIFDLYNKEKRIRFFSFLVGEEATDFEQVRWMACNNRGYMVHVNNLADVQEKVQHYVKVMTRPISRQSASIHQENAIWSGMARERMSNEFVISVSYPVVLDGTFMGVSAVSIPLIELSQIAHPSLVGSRSYFFMLDNNGYAMFHPQLRPMDLATSDVKPTYNNMEFSEVDIQLYHSKERPHLNCHSSTSVEADILFAVENVRHIYPQKNRYYTECIEGTHFTVSAAVADHDGVRLKRARPLDMTRIDLDWMRDHNWRLHPKWRYCLLNDSDIQLTAERAFTQYASEMRSLGELPTLCRDRRGLVDRLLLDLQATSTLSTIWDLDWQKNKANGVHLTFLATPSGMIRYMNQSLGDLFYEHPEGLAENNTDFAYKHFVLEMNQKTTEENYFKRAVRQRGKIVVDVNRHTRMWQTSDKPNAYGNIENETLLGVAYKAIYRDDALIGVVGMEFLYDKLAEQMKQFGCSPDDDHTRCFLLDEHAYVIYTSQKDTSYSEFVKAHHWETASPAPTHNATQSRRRRPAHKQQQQQQQRIKLSAAKQPGVVLGSFFGHVNRVTEWTMETLIKKGFYTETTFVDNQAMCESEPILTTVAASATRPLLSVAKMLLRVLGLCFDLLQRLYVIPSSFSQDSIVNAFTATFRTTAEGRYSCRMKSKFYLANPGDPNQKHRSHHSAALLEENYSERPCKHNAAQCAVKVYAAWVHSTNLLLVVVKQGSRSQCYDGIHCAMSVPPSLSFGFQRMDANHLFEDDISSSRMRREEWPTTESADDEDESPEVQVDKNDAACLTYTPKKRKNVVQCLRDDFLEDESDLPCSLAAAKGTRAWLAMVPIVLILLL